MGCDCKGCIRLLYGFSNEHESCFGLQQQQGVLVAWLHKPRRKVVHVCSDAQELWLYVSSR
jgi:hypothetical protein